MTLDFILIPVAYLIGSLSSAIIICKMTGLPDPRTQGSGNPGATNVLRIGGKWVAAIVLFGDVLKGFIPVVVALQLNLPSIIIAAVGLAAFFGHLYPVFFSFKGGKGVATAVGVLFALSWLSAIILIATWLVVAAIFRISSLAAICATIAAPLVMWMTLAVTDYLVMTIIICAFLLWRHRTNIRRILKGTEPRIGRRQARPD